MPALPLLLRVAHTRRAVFAGTVYGLSLVALFGVSILCPGVVRTEIWNAGRSRPDRFGGRQESPAEFATFLESGWIRTKSVGSRSPGSRPGTSSS